MEHLENIHSVSEKAHQINTALSWVLLRPFVLFNMSSLKAYFGPQKHFFFGSSFLFISCHAIFLTKMVFTHWSTNLVRRIHDCYSIEVKRRELLPSLSCDLKSTVLWTYAIPGRSVLQHGLWQEGLMLEVL